MNVLETERLTLRKLDSALDAEFIFELLNTPKFVRYIGDRGVRSADEASDFIEDRYRQSYRDHGYGLYVVELKTDNTPVGLCGFVRRESLDSPDIGFAFLPGHEGKGYGFESASGMMQYGRETLGFTTVLAITSLDNDASARLLKKLEFTFDEIIDSGGEKLKLFSNKTA